MNKRYLLKRFFAFYLDGIINFLIMFLVLFVFKINYNHDVYLFPLFIIICFFYYLTFDLFFERTPGKIILHLKIDGFEKNNKIIFLKQVLLRNLFRWIPFDQISIFFHDDYKMWHDIISKTRVIINP